MKKLFSLILFGFIASQIYAQSTAHYLFSDFKDGVIKVKEGVEDQMKLNYNTVLGEMIYQEKGKNLTVNDPSSVEYAIIDGRKFIPVDDKFYEEIKKGEVSLYALHSGRLLPPGSPTAYGGTSTTEAVTNQDAIIGSGEIFELKLPSDYKVLNKEVYYFKKANEYIKANNLKQIMKAFEDKADAIKSFAKKNKLKFKDQLDFIKLTDFLNK